MEIKPTTIEELVERVNLRLVEVDFAVRDALEVLNRLRALHGKKALTPEGFMKFYRGQRLK